MLAYGFDPIGVAEGTYDPDMDGLDNLVEQAAGTDPHVADSDGDGWLDAVETNTGLYVDGKNTGMNPLLGDSDGDTLSDVDELLSTVFVSSTSGVGSIGGAGGADAMRNAAAVSAGLGSGFLAWVSDSSTNARDRVPRATYRRIDRALVAVGIEDLTDGALTSPIIVDELGNTAVLYRGHWKPVLFVSDPRTDASHGLAALEWRLALGVDTRRRIRHAPERLPASMRFESGATSRWFGSDRSSKWRRSSSRHHTR